MGHTLKLSKCSSCKAASEVFNSDLVRNENSVPKQSANELIHNCALHHFEAAKQLSLDYQHESAVRHLNKAIALWPEDDTFYAARAECFVHLCDMQSAILNYRRACLMQPDVYSERLAFLYYLNAQCLVEQNLLIEALENFSQAAELRPDIGGYRIRSITCLSPLGYNENCLTLITERINQLQLQPDSSLSDNKSEISNAEERNDSEMSVADLYVLRARINKLLSRTSDCYDDLVSALSIDKGHLGASALKNALEAAAEELKDEAVKLTLVGRHKDALLKLTKAITTNPSIADFHILRGAIHRQIGDFNSAIDDYLLAMTKTNSDEQSETYQKAQYQLLLTYNDFAVECLSKNFLDEALVLLNKAIKDEKTEKGLYYNRAECFYKRGEITFALADLQQAFELDPHDDSIRLRMAAVHEECARQFYEDTSLREAEFHLNKALEYNPSSAECYVLRAKIRQAQKDVNGARCDVVTSMLLKSCNPEIMAMMTRLFPGKTVADVVSSELAEQLRLKLGTAIVEREPASENKSIKPDSRVKINRETANQVALQFGTTRSERLFNMHVTSEKKRVNQLVKDVLQSSSTDSQYIGVINRAVQST